MNAISAYNGGDDDDGGTLLLFIKFRGLGMRKMPTIHLSFSSPKKR